MRIAADRFKALAGEYLENRENRNRQAGDSGEAAINHLKKRSTARSRYFGAGLQPTNFLGDGTPMQATIRA